MSIEFWYMVPVGIVVTTVGMASGVGGATFYAPLFILALGLPPRTAIASGLVVEVVGFGNGVYAYVRRQLIDYRIGQAMLVATLPAAVVGAILSSYVQPDFLRMMLATGLLVVAVSFLRAPDAAAAARLDELAHKPAARAETCLTTARGEEICYTVCNKTEGRLISGLGGFFMGLISSGLGELNGYFLLQRCRVPSSISVATTVFVVAITALVASAGHLVQIVQDGGADLVRTAHLLAFTLPGVVIGAQLGPSVAERVPDRVMEIFLGCLLTVTAGLLLFETGLH